MEYADANKTSSTRWLCLEMYVSRKLKKVKGLKSYSLSGNFPDDNRLKRLKSDYSDNMTENVSAILSSCTPMFLRTGSVTLHV